MDLSLNTYSECVDSFRAADLAMGSAFRQKLSAYQRALELAGPEPERGFQSQFARDCGCDRTYISRIHRVVSDPELLIAINNFSGVGINTLTALAAADPETKTAALEQLEQTGELTTRDISELSEHEVAQLERDLEQSEREQSERELAQRERDLQTLVPTDANIDRLVTLLISGGQQLESYCTKTNSSVQPDKFAIFVANRLVDLSDRCGSDPEVYTSSLSAIREFIRLVGNALDSVPSQRDSHLKLVK